MSDWTKTHRQIWRGLFWSERYGSHPGTVPLIVLVALGGLAGSWVGGLIMAAVFGSMYLVGAYERGRR